jgi:AP-1 complex subunit gamma-1
MGLFGPGPTATAPSPPAAIPPSDPMSAFNIPATQTPQPAPSQPAVPRLTSYTAYEKNELKITLTPQTSAAQPGTVMILARFQVAGSSPATGLSFQAAVPKVGFGYVHVIFMT